MVRLVWISSCPLQRSKVSFCLKATLIKSNAFSSGADLGHFLQVICISLSCEFDTCRLQMIQCLWVNLCDEWISESQSHSCHKVSESSIQKNHQIAFRYDYCTEIRYSWMLFWSWLWFSPLFKRFVFKLMNLFVITLIHSFHVYWIKVLISESVHSTSFLLSAIQCMIQWISWSLLRIIGQLISVQIYESFCHDTDSFIPWFADQCLNQWIFLSLA